MISIKLDDDTIEAGAFLTGRVFWSTEDGTRPRRLLIAASWETVGRGNAVRGVPRAMEFVPKAAEATIPFRLLIPHEGPITFTTQLTGVVWKLRVRVDQRGIDEFEEVSFRVDPRVIR
jgi:hypothetical protein